LTISGHSKSVSCLAIDRGGGVMVTGSNDYHVKFWNFGAMTKQIEHFRLLDPVPFHVINRLSFNSNYKEILVVAGNAQPAIISREGSDVVEFIKGD
jgi:WD40 repeat protein